MFSANNDREYVGAHLSQLESQVGSQRGAVIWEKCIVSRPVLQILKTFTISNNNFFLIGHSKRNQNPLQKQSGHPRGLLNETAPFRDITLDASPIVHLFSQHTRYFPKQQIVQSKEPLHVSIFSSVLLSRPYHQS